MESTGHFRLLWFCDTGLDARDVGLRLEFGGREDHDRVVGEEDGVGGCARGNNEVFDGGAKMWEELLVAGFNLP